MPISLPPKLRSLKPKISQLLWTWHLLIWVAILTLNAAPCSHAEPFAQDKLPPALQSWCDWVLDSEDNYTCPLVMGEQTRRHCTWPGTLELKIDAKGAHFMQRGYLDRSGWVILPGSAALWPHSISMDEKPVPILRHNKLPALFLDPGPYTVRGQFTWEQIPAFIQADPDLASISLTVAGKKAETLQFRHGNLYLRQATKAQAPVDSLKFKVQRLLDDSIPQILTSRIVLSVSGQEREIVTAPALPQGFAPLAITGKLPARIEADGRLRILVKPGEWELTLKARNTDTTTTRQGIQRPPQPSVWADTEIWCINKHPELHTLSISEAPALDPSQTDLPAAWKRLPVYLLHKDTILRLEHRPPPASSAPTERLHLEREIWLDFSGESYSVKDTIRGALGSSSRLETDSTLHLGRVRLNGQEQFITRTHETGAEGVEIRTQQIHLQADSTISAESIQAIPAVGWKFNPVTLKANLNLPPGWRILAASGTDKATPTWVQQWSLLDLFVVLLTSLGFGRLWNWRYGLLALAGLALTYQEPLAPQLIWLHLLGATALLRVVPAGLFRRLVYIYFAAAALGVSAILLLFSIQQIRSAVFPQLEPVRPSYAAQYDSAAVPVRDDVMLESTNVRTKSMASVSAAAGIGMVAQAPQPQVYSAELKTQTGPGIPTWHWRRINLEFNGSVEQQRRLGLVLLSPLMTKIYLVCGVILALGMLFRFWSEINTTPKSAARANDAPLADAETDANPTNDTTCMLSGAVLILVLAAGLLLVPSGPAVAADDALAKPGYPPCTSLPSAELLEELRQRLTAPPDCAPDCASIPQVRIRITPAELRVEQRISTCVLSAVPMVFPARQLHLTQALDAQGHIPFLMRDQNQSLWVRAAAGITTVVLSAALPRDMQQFEIPVPAPVGNISINATGWEVENTTPDGSHTATIAVKRPRPDSPSGVETQLNPSSDIPLFAEVRRRLKLEVDWKMETVFTRLSRDERDAVVQIPLISGEQVLTPGLKTKDRNIIVELNANTRTIRWESALKHQNPMTLEAPANGNFHEIWQIQISPLWHAEYAGALMVHSYQNGHWLAEWHPRAGEKLQLDITRPQGTSGQHITIEACKLKHTSGEHRSETSMHLSLRSSLATEHIITLPADDIEVQQVKIDGRNTRIQQKNRSLTLALKRGLQQIEIIWQQHEPRIYPTTTPWVDLGCTAVNIDLNLSLPHNRWVLAAGGPTLGPAVLFWGIVLVLTAGAYILGRFAPTPLKSWHWFTLGAGLSQAPLPALVLVCTWLILLGMRKKYAVHIHSPALFNLMQLALGLVSILALSALATAVQHGLLGLPEMQVAGNHSSAWVLNWYQDRSGTILPQGWVLTAPMFSYRLLMLAWALWLAMALLKWLRWGWSCFSTGALWREIKSRRKADKES